MRNVCVDISPTYQREKRARYSLLASVEASTPKQRRVITRAFHEYFPCLDHDKMIAQLTDTIRHARTADHWASQRGRVLVGSFKDSTQYDPLMLHESCHRLADMNSLPATVDMMTEEGLCNDFAVTACKAMGLPYDAELITLCRSLGSMHRLSHAEVTSLIEKYSATEYATILSF